MGMKMVDGRVPTDLCPDCEVRQKTPVSPRCKHCNGRRANAIKAWTVYVPYKHRSGPVIRLITASRG